jgi:hypothetical protein
MLENQILGCHPRMQLVVVADTWVPGPVYKLPFEFHKTLNKLTDIVSVSLPMVLSVLCYVL